jgi:gliding motility-associated-like protein
MMGCFCLMKKYIIISIYLFSYLFSKSQVNLVLNPSFENLDSCVNINGKLNAAYYWQGLDNTPGHDEDCFVKLFNSCSTFPSLFDIPSQYNLYYQYPRTGKSLVSFGVYGDVGLNNIRGYIIGHLSIKLLLGKTYCITYFVNLPNWNTWAFNRLGCYFDDGSLLLSSANKCQSLNIIPHIDNNPSVYLNDTLGWMKVQGLYTANGTETRLTLGNFYNDISTGRQLFNNTGLSGGSLNIDDISVIPIDVTANAGADVSICIGDSVHLGRPQEIGLECSWYKPTIATAFATTSDIWFKATQAGTYTFIQKMDNCFTSFDTVHITVVSDCSVLQPIKDIPNVFTPNGDGVNDVWIINLGFGNTLNTLSIFNRWGIEILNDKLEMENVITWSGRTSSGIECSAGVYFYALEYLDNKGDKQKKNGYVSLFR